MKTRLGAASKLGACGLLVAGSVSMAGIDPQVYKQPEPEKGKPTLLEEVAGWVNSAASLGSGHSPAFYWIETPPVQDDPRLQQVNNEKREHLLAHLPLPDTLQRVVAPGGMFRRVENTPAALKEDLPQRQGHEGLIIQQPNLLLSANVPAALQLGNADVIWEIHARDGGEDRQMAGRSLQLSLPVGGYEVNLQIGGYEEQASVEVVDGKLAAPNFAADIGRLRVSSNMQADWRVVAASGPVVGRNVLEHAGGDQINTIVPVGEYDVTATVNSARQTQRVRVNRGEVSTASISVPTGTVSLVATLGNSPAMRPMRWTLYRLDGGRQEVASPRRHSAILVVAPGHYEAVANLDGRERRREFTVLNGSNNNIVMAMD
ncbi:hypothetical protein VSS37_20895 [Candidatus Thiothrix sp. Deng01]|uniref:PEGA domain-containing protein n=1 Tax=Candidatus Thiothrix phosphatis TaxID=3112415 RepID=A0ABU6D574_9GAMM|nr:hypothetical protein [Candidatus Thiothrix sp. Deng01]MEB4593448.1 hypothetical protein [Candidatus Thiothrix sp. Deng01]